MKLKLLWGKTLSCFYKDEQLAPNNSAQTNPASINCTSSFQVLPILDTQDPSTPHQSSVSSNLALTQKLKEKSNRAASLPAHEIEQKEFVETIQKLLGRQNFPPPNSTALDIGLDLYKLEELSRKPVSVNEMQHKLDYLGDVIRLMSEYLIFSNTRTLALMPRLATALFDACSSCSHWGWAERYFYGMMRLVDISMVEVEYRDDVPIYNITPHPYNAPETAILVTLTCYLGCQMARYDKSEDFLMKEIFVMRIIPCLVYLCNFQQELTDSPGIALMYIFFRLDLSLAEMVDINFRTDFSRYNRVPLRLRRRPGDEVSQERPENHIRLHFPPVRVFRISIETFIPQSDPNFKDKFQTELLNSPVFLSSESEISTTGSDADHNKPDLESNFFASPFQNTFAGGNDDDPTASESIPSGPQPPTQPNLNFDTYDYSSLDQININNFQDVSWENHIRELRSRGANEMSQRTQTTQPLGSNANFTSGPQEFNFTSASNRERLGFFPVIPTRDFTNPVRPRFRTTQRDDRRMNDLNHLSDPLRRRIEEQNHSIPLLPRGIHGQHSPPEVRHSSTNDQSGTNPNENLREARTTANANHDVSKKQQKTESNAFLLILTQSEYQPPTYLTRTLMPFWIRCAVLGYLRRRDSNTLVRSDQSFESYVNALLQWDYTTETDESIRGIYRALFNLIADQKYMKKKVDTIFIWTNYIFLSEISG
jgi:hypothetical protein